MAESTVSHTHGRPRTFGPLEIVASAANGEPVIVSAANAAIGAVLARTADGFQFANSSTGWSTTGNASLNAASNFLGTIDAVNLSLRSGGNETALFTPQKNAMLCINPSVSSFTVSSAAFSSGIAFSSGGGGAFDIASGGSALILACAGGTRSIANTGGALITACTSGTTSISNASGAFIAAAGGTITGGNRIAIMAAAAGTINPAHSNAAVIGAGTLTSQASNSLTSNAMYATAFNVTCDATEKKAIVDAAAGEGSDAFTAKLMSVKPKQYRWASEDDAAPKRAGFIADEVEAAFPGVVKRTWRKEVPVTLTAGKWKDELGAEYADATVDKTRNAVCTNEPLQHAVIDTTAMMSALLSASRHLQTQVTTLKTDTIAVARLPSAIPATNIAGGTVDNTEFGYLDGVTSSIQAQLNAIKADIVAMKADITLLKANVTIRIL